MLQFPINNFITEMCSLSFERNHLNTHNNTHTQPQLRSVNCSWFLLFGLIMKLTLNETIYCFYNNATCSWWFWKPIFLEPLLVCGRNKMSSGVFVQNSDKAAVCNQHELVNQGWVFLQGTDHWKKILHLVGQWWAPLYVIVFSSFTPGKLNCIALY